MLSAANKIVTKWESKKYGTDASYFEIRVWETYFEEIVTQS